VVLESDEWKCETWVSAEPELEWDVESSFGDASGEVAHVSGKLGWLSRGTASSRYDLGKSWDITNHICVSDLVTWGLGEFVPDVEPVTVVFVDSLSTNFDFDVSDEYVSDPIEPSESVFGVRAFDSWKSYL
jgi:hypothetical protein